MGLPYSPVFIGDQPEGARNYPYNLEPYPQMINRIPPCIEPSSVSPSTSCEQLDASKDSQDTEEMTNLTLSDYPGYQATPASLWDPIPRVAGDIFERKPAIGMAGEVSRCKNLTIKADEPPSFNQERRERPTASTTKVFDTLADKKCDYCAENDLTCLAELMPWRKLQSSPRIEGLRIQGCRWST